MELGAVFIHDGKKIVGTFGSEDFHSCEFGNLAMGRVRDLDLYEIPTSGGLVIRNNGSFRSAIGNGYHGGRHERGGERNV